MFELLETIKVEDGKVANLLWHEKRFNYSYRKMYKRSPSFRLTDIITAEKIDNGDIFKLRFLYNEDRYKIEIKKYVFRQIKKLKVIEDNNINYDLKYTDREYLKHLYVKKEEADDVLIIKNGYVTDTSFANIVFFDGVKWYTPSTPLLKGTARERLLFSQQIVSVPIKLNDIKKFTKFMIINAFNDFDKNNAVPVSNIIY